MSKNIYQISSTEFGYYLCHLAAGVVKCQFVRSSDTAPLLLTVPAPAGAVPCSCGRVYATGGTVRSHLNYIKKHRAEQEAIFFRNARTLTKKEEIAVYKHPDPKT